MVAEEGGDLFDLASLKKLYAVTAELEKLKDEGLVEEVVSAANVKIVEGTAAALLVHPILPGPPEGEEDVRLFREKVSAERLVRDNLILADGSGAILILRLSPKVEVREDIQAQILTRLEEISAKYAGPERFYISGNAAFLVYVNRYMRQDLALLLPVVVVVIVLVLLGSFRNWRGVVLPLAVVLVGLIWTMGLVGLTDRKLTMISTFLPVVLVAVGSAYGIHVVNDFLQRAKPKEDKRELVLATVREMFVPVLGAATTTAAGFLTLLSSFLVPTREFGVFSAFGVMVCFLLAMVMIPAVLVLLPLPKPQARAQTQARISPALAQIFSRRPWIPLAVVLVVLGALLAGVPRLQVESDVTRYFREDSPVVEGLRLVDERFGGSQEISVIIDTGKRDGLKDPEVLRFMDRLQRFLEERPEVGATSSLADLVKESYFTLRGDDPAFYTIPDTSRAVAQVLLLYEMGGGEVTGSMATRDFRMGRISARVRSVGLAGYDELLRAVSEFVEREKPEKIVDWYVTGSPSLYIQLSKKLIASQLTSLGTSFGAVGAIVALLMLSLGAGLLSLIPLLVAVAGNFGVMGYVNAYLDMATVMIASLTVGIGVDYAVHFLSRYRNERGKGIGPRFRPPGNLPHLGKGDRDQRPHPCLGLFGHAFLAVWGPEHLRVAHGPHHGDEHVGGAFGFARGFGVCSQMGLFPLAGFCRLAGAPGRGFRPQERREKMKRAVKLGVAFVLFFGLLGFPQTADEILKRVEEQGFFGTGRGSLYAALSVEIQEKGQPKVDYGL
jgi:predicted RND superfamily exporter protein